jgi:ABC transporter, ATP-binding protein
LKLIINNIGKLKNAEVEINGITVITGENDTGKSTVGKVLWSVFNSFYEIKNQVRKDKINSIFRESRRFLGLQQSRKLRNKIVQESEIDEEIDLDDLINQIEINLRVERNNNKEIERILDKIKKRTKLPEKEVLKEIIQKNFDNEFNYQINNLNLLKNGNIVLDIKNKKLKLAFNNNKVELSEDEYFSLYAKAILIDNPRILDGLDDLLVFPLFNENAHSLDLIKLLRDYKDLTATDRVLNKERLLQIEKIINSVVSGNFEKDEVGSYIYKDDDGIDINIKNLSTGLKTFFIMKLLMLNNELEENGTIILDEPEIHLHPEWQVKFAELIVLLQKELGMHILLTTHSPYFLKAIQVFSKKYEISDKCKYYIGKMDEKQSILIDTSDKLENIFYKLTIPFENLMNEEEMYENR